MGTVESRDRCRHYEFEGALRSGDPDILASARESTWFDILVQLAGPAAERRWRGFPKHPVPTAISELTGDGRTAVELLRRLGREGDFAQAWDEAWDLVEDVWQAIDALASTLLERHELDGEEVAAITVAALPGRFPLAERELADTAGSGGH